MSSHSEPSRIQGGITPRPPRRAKLLGGHVAKIAVRFRSKGLR